MKKLTVLLFAMALGFSLVACGTKANDDAQNDNSIESTTGTEENAEGTVEDEFADDEFADDEVVEEEFVMPTISEELQPLRDAVANALGENYWPSMIAPIEMYEGWGLSADMLEDYFIEGPMMSAHVDTLMVLKPAEGKKDDVLAFVNNYVAYQQDEMNQYPSNVARGAAVMSEEIGDYVCVVLLGGSVPEEASIEDQVAHCKSVNEAALNAIKGVVNQ